MGALGVEENYRDEVGVRVLIHRGWDRVGTAIDLSFIHVPEIQRVLGGDRGWVGAVRAYVEVAGVV